MQIVLGCQLVPQFKSKWDTHQIRVHKDLTWRTVHYSVPLSQAIVGVGLSVHLIEYHQSINSLVQFSPESEFLLWLVHISGSQKLLRGIQVLYKNTQSSCNIRNPKIQAGFLADFLMLQLVHILAFLNDLENTALSLHEFLPHFLCNLCAKALCK